MEPADSWMKVCRKKVAMRKPAVVSPMDDVTLIGRVFDTPVVVKGVTWLPLAEVIVWILTTWMAGKRRPERSLYQRMGVGFVRMPFILGFEWCHNFAHAAAAHMIGKPMDAMRITWGTPLIVYYDLNDTSVTPRQHIIRALGGPLFNALMLPIVLLLRNGTNDESLARELIDTAVGTNAFLCTMSLLPMPGIDGGPILKWSMVERGSTREEADGIVQKVNGILGVLLGIASAISFKKKRGLIGTLMAVFSALALAIGTGLLREE
jgi:Zn-dependent protease